MTAASAAPFKTFMEDPLEMTFINARTVAETTSVIGRSAAICIAARLVESANEADGAARADRGSSPATTTPAGTKRPRRVNRSLSRPRPRANRLLTVPTGQPRCRAACSWVRPSRSHSTTGTRKRSGSRSISS